MALVVGRLSPKLFKIILHLLFFWWWLSLGNGRPFPHSIPDDYGPAELADEKYRHTVTRTQLEGRLHLPWYSDPHWRATTTIQ